MGYWPQQPQQQVSGQVAPPQSSMGGSGNDIQQQQQQHMAMAAIGQPRPALDHPSMMQVSALACL